MSAIGDSGATVTAQLNFISREGLVRALESGLRSMDYRQPRAPGPSLSEAVECLVRDARSDAAGFTLDTGGFTLERRRSAVRDWFDADEVMRVYYEECRRLARELTGASHAFTFDHLIREPGRQTSGGGLLKQSEVTTAERGGGYVASVHMDYTDSSTWREYLALHGLSEPEGASRVIVLNFWRPLFDTPERDPLALCDARTVEADDLLELMIYGYGHRGYSWHDIGISIYQVAHSPRQQWYYYSDMTPDEVLLIKTYDSRGVVGRGCPHCSFANLSAPATAPPRRSVELRVLCYVGARDRD